MTETLLNISDRRELFIDDHLIDRLDGGTLRLHAPQRREVVLETDAPWEGNMSGLYATVFRDGDVYRMYYRTGHMDVAERAGGGQAAADAMAMRICYAESIDGLHWRKPELGLYEVEGSKANNIVWTGVGDELDRRVTWNGNADVSPLAGQPVRLRFELKDADLFAMRFGIA